MKSRGLRGAALTAAAVLLAIPLASLLLDLFGPLSFPWQRAEAFLTIDSAEAPARSVTVVGRTDLPDGAVLSFFFLHESEWADTLELPVYQYGGHAAVLDGRYRFDAQLDEWPPGTVEFSVWFEVGPEVEQPAEVVQRYGANGEHLAGDQVSIDSPGDPKMLLANGSLRLVDLGLAP